ncbi:MAG: ROK family protein [Bacteroidetes bacterium]|nr:ROK family protein [Bacteroidota bacterium]
MSEYVIGIDVGGTRIKMAAVTRDGTLKQTRIIPSGYHLSAQEIQESLMAEIQFLQSQMGNQPLGLGLGFPGVVNPQQGIVMLPGKLDLEGFPIVKHLSESLSIPVIADNDGRLSIIAESRYGKAVGYNWAVSITLGTGVGSGIMLDGTILRDSYLQFGTQASHIVQNSKSDRLCITNARGTANLLCSATALTLLVRDGLARGLPSILNEQYFDNPLSIDFKCVIEGADQGDRLCIDALQKWRTELGWFLVSVVHMYSPEIIILGGGAVASASSFIKSVRAHVNQSTFKFPHDRDILIEISEHPDYSVTLGAASIAWEQYNT